jgi:RimJ/RimL family protein N-acetyltransferase
MDAAIPLPLRTERLVLRMPAEADAPLMAAYRGDPDVARYQDWPLPYPPDDALAGIGRQAHLSGPTPGEAVNVAIEHDGSMVGDLYVEIRPPEDGGAVAFLGYTLDPTQQGRGYAAEAAGAMVDALFAHTPVHRIAATLDPVNLPSMRILDLLGFLPEGTTRRSVPVRGEWVDDLRYGLLRDERAVWLARPTSFASIRLVELDDHLARAYGELRVHPHQEQFVASVLGSYRDALFPEVVDGAPVVPWLRGVEVTDHHGVTHPAGFVMLAEVTDAHPEPYLWRLLVDRWWQRAGVGRAVLDAVVTGLREQGRSSLLTSWVEGVGGPRRFYERYGFVTTGRTIDDETEARLSW